MARTNKKMTPSEYVVGVLKAQGFAVQMSNAVPGGGVGTAIDGTKVAFDDLGRWAHYRKGGEAKEGMGGKQLLAYLTTI